MSPLHNHIDIVPMEHYGSMLETSIDVVANHHVNIGEGTYGSSSLRQLINNSPDRVPKKGGPSPHGARQLQVRDAYILSVLKLQSYFGVYILSLCPSFIFTQSPSYAGSSTAPTAATSMGGYTSSSMEKSNDYDEDDEEEQLVLPEFDQLPAAVVPLRWTTLSASIVEDNQMGG